MNIKRKIKAPQGKRSNKNKPIKQQKVKRKIHILEQLFLNWCRGRGGGMYSENLMKAMGNVSSKMHRGRYLWPTFLGVHEASGGNNRLHKASLSVGKNL